MDEKEDHKVTSKLKDILAKANELASAKAVRKASDEDFMSRIEAVCLVRRIYDGLCLDNHELLPKMRRLYPEFARRIDAKGNKQDALPLVKSFHRFIYGTSFVRLFTGVKKWEEELADYEAKFGLDNDSEVLFNPQETTGLSIVQLKRRSSQSKLTYVEYLSELTKKEFARINDAANERQLRRQLKGLNEKIIPDFLNIRISSTMSVPTLRALEAIYTLRSWLSGASHDTNDPAYANLQVQRMWQILKALKTKYRKAKALTDKIEILSFIDTLEQDLSCKHSDFAIEEATKLLTKYSGNSSGKSKHSDRSDNDLTPFQRLRLQLITKALGSEFSELAIASGTNLSQLATELLPEADTAFDLDTLSFIEHLLTPSLREAIFNRFTHLLEAAMKTNDTAEISSLLTLFPYWNSNPIHRSLLKDLSRKAEKALKETQKATNLDSDPSEARIISRLNPIAAEIYTKIDTLIGKYESRTIPA